MHHAQLKTYVAVSFLLFASVCVASPEDRRLSSLLVGEWQGGRHAEQYMTGGTWRFDPAEGTTHGTWRIAAGRFIKIWATGPSESYEIVSLDKGTFVIRGKDGIVYRHRRMARPLSP
jgi:hypothetical protein